MDIFENINPKERVLRPKSERIQDALKLIDSAPPAHNAEEAFNLVNEAFTKIEQEEKEPRMEVGLFADMLIVQNNKKNIYCNWYVGHILCIRENGAIEMRGKEAGGFDRTAFEKDSRYINNFNIIFSKNGADNQGVW